MSQPSQSSDLIGKTLNQQWKVVNRLGGGSFGEIYLAEHIESGAECAVKVESRSTKHPQLIYEAKIVKYISGGEGVCQLLFAFSDLRWNYMGIDRLGPSLEDVFNKLGRRFSTKTICMIGIQMLQRVEFLHNKNFIHRDIKPDNFLVGLGSDATTIYMIDFGLAKRYKDPRNQQHIQYREDKSLTGTARYASLNAHKGIEQSRRDDLEAIGFVLMYFVRKGCLPWQGIRAEKKNDKYKLIEAKKNATSIRALCKGAAPAFAMYLHYVRGLRFETRPDYGYLKGLFHELLKNMSTSNDLNFDWITDGAPGAPKRSASHNGHQQSTNPNIDQQPLHSSNQLSPRHLVPGVQSSQPNLKCSDEPGSRRNGEETGGDKNIKQTNKKELISSNSAQRIVPNSTAHAQMGSHPQANPDSELIRVNQAPEAGGCSCFPRRRK
eukprot:GHVH01004664.1.p1 GENE.GHVH01004664.1~~GHVH01004664.1.p1  ORF type:complete len:435 (+),score=50.61 GHVH01004664.1:512-1816(+)